MHSYEMEAVFALRLFVLNLKGLDKMFSLHMFTFTLVLRLHKASNPATDSGIQSLCHIIPQTWYFSASSHILCVLWHLCKHHLLIVSVCFPVLQHLLAM